jgi:hypothetical protein
LSNINKLIEIVLNGRNDNNLNFEDLKKVARHFSTTEDIEGSHHIYRFEGIIDRIIIQPKRGKAKPYQVKQVRNILKKYFIK